MRRHIRALITLLLVPVGAYTKKGARSGEAEVGAAGRELEAIASGSSLARSKRGLAPETYIP